MTKKVEHKQPRPKLASPEREAILRQWWETTEKTVVQIVMLCNEHPGTVVDTKNIRVYADNLGLRPRLFQSTETKPAPLSQKLVAKILGPEAIPLEDAIAWAQNARIPLVGDVDLDLAAINKVRESYGLPKYEIKVRPNTFSAKARRTKAIASQSASP